MAAPTPAGRSTRAYPSCFSPVPRGLRRWSNSFYTTSARSRFGSGTAASCQYLCQVWNASCSSSSASRHALQYLVRSSWSWILPAFRLGYTVHFIPWAFLSPRTCPFFAAEEIRSRTPCPSWLSHSALWPSLSYLLCLFQPPVSTFECVHDQICFCSWFFQIPKLLPLGYRPYHLLYSDPSKAF